MIDAMFQNGALPTLERVVEFTHARHALLTHNIANLSTPHFQPRDVSPRTFQAALGRAIDRRRRQPDPVRGDLPMTPTRELRFDDRGRLTLRPEGNPRRHILFHDRNNRDLERIMQDLAENTLTHRAAVDLVRNQFEMMRIAIRERI